MFCYSNLTRETGGFELASTITLALQANRLTKCASHLSQCCWLRSANFLKKGSMAVDFLWILQNLTELSSRTLSNDCFWHLNFSKNIWYFDIDIDYGRVKLLVFGDFLIRIFPHSDWIPRFTKYTFKKTNPSTQKILSFKGSF